MIIYDVGVRVPRRPMAMRVAMWFGPLPSLVDMIMMDIMGMFVFVEFLCVRVHQNPFVMLRPHGGGYSRGYQDAHRENQCSSLHAQASTQLTGYQVENQERAVQKAI